MDVLHTHCCGLDVHKKTVVACLLTPGAAGNPTKEIRTFGTMTADLLTLADWLAAAGCTHVAMESTGVYWRPIYNLLEGQFELLVVNAQHIKAVPGRKTDVRDAEWIANLLRHGLLRASFVPAAAQRELRDLTRYRTSLVQDRARHINRLQKVLEAANIKVAAVATDVTGVSVRAMLEALLEGQEDPVVLAELARGKLRQKRELLAQALEGRLGAHHRFLVGEHLEQLDYLAEAIERVTAEIATRVAPLQRQAEHLDSVPGLNERGAQVALAELGADLSRFPTAGHLASWAGLCPGNHESAGKRQSGRTRKGNGWLRQLLMEAAHGAVRMKGTYLAAQYRHLIPRLGRKKALVAVAHSLLVIIYYVLTRDEPYRELGGDYFTERQRQTLEARLVRRLEKLGHEVILKPKEQAA